MKRRVELESAYILHVRAYQDTSAILDVFSQNYGRVSVLAKGIKRGKKRNSGLYQPFQPLLISWVGKNELVTLTHVESRAVSVLLSGKIISCGIYINEILTRLLPKADPHPGLYSLYEQVLDVLSKTESHSGSTTNQHIEETLRLFEKRLLGELGYGLVTGSDVETGEPVQTESYYYYFINKGPVKAGCCSSEEKKTHNEQRTSLDDPIIIKGMALHFLEREVPMSEPEDLRDIKLLMRSSLATHLGSRPLNSRKMIRVNKMDRRE